MTENQTWLLFALFIACLNHVKLINEQMRLLALTSETNVEITQMLTQERYLFEASSFFSISSLFEAIPFLMVANQTQPRMPRREGETLSNYHYWSITHPILADDDNPATSFRAMYRMNRATFEKLVNDLGDHSEFTLPAHNSLPTYIQISCAIFRLANWHLGYRLANAAWGVAHGTYINTTRRFIKAVMGTYKHVIQWPVDSEKVREIQEGFPLRI